MINDFVKSIAPIYRRIVRTACVSLFTGTPKIFFRKLPRNRLGDRLYALRQFIKAHQRLPNENKFNDKLYKIRTGNEIYDPLRIFVTDKEYAKLYVQAVVGDQYNVPTLDILRNETDVAKFMPDQNCVIKPTHSSGKYIFHEVGTPIDKGILKDWLKHNYYDESREPNYRNLTPKIIIEPMLFDLKTIVDYKVFCVDGVPKMIKVDFDRGIKHLRKFYDIDWKALPFSWNSPPTEKNLPKPNSLNEVLDIAGRLSKEFSFVRVDFYIIDKSVYVGEITNCDGGGRNVFYPRSGEDFATDLCFKQQG